jgi:hypothetical protein
MMSRFLRCLLAALAALPLVGCSSGTGVKKVTGTVTLDGDPLAGAEVQFWPKDDIQLGSHLSRTGADGRFELFQDPRPGVGIKPGRYVVLVTKYGAKEGWPPKPGDDLPVAAAEGMPWTKNTLPAIYNDKEHSPLIVEIQKGDNDFPIPLESQPASQGSPR